MVHKALDLGITLFDTADIYGERGGSEEFLGRVLGERRKDIVLATKFGMAVRRERRPSKGAARRYIMMRGRRQPRRLKTDWIDLYQLHAPDPLTPIEETLRALDDLVRQGKVRYVGCSNLPAWRVVEAQWTARQHNLERLHLLPGRIQPHKRASRKRNCMPANAGLRHGAAAVLPAGERAAHRQVQPGAAHRPVRASPPPSTLPIATAPKRTGRSSKRWKPSARSGGRSLLELAFSWLLAKPCVTSVIAGATRPEQLEQNVEGRRLGTQRRGYGRGRPDHPAEGVSLIFFSSPPSFMGERIKVRGHLLPDVRGAAHPHPCPLPQAGEGVLRRLEANPGVGAVAIGLLG